jgi:organic hydroperoxide reductase OsmC/OhrA
MVGRQHHYRILVTWTGNDGAGTASPKGYSRAHRIEVPGKSAIDGSSDPGFLGDPTRWNPEELLLASLSACHKLWYLDLCARAGIIVTAYTDEAEGCMEETAAGSGKFTNVVLYPIVTIAAGSDRQAAVALHDKAHAMCFIANSVNFPVEHRPMIIATESTEQ